RVSIPSTQTDDSLLTSPFSSREVMMRTSESFNGHETPVGEPDTYDVVGIGFGPANLALAVCLEEEAEEPGGRDFARLFFESKPKSIWHPGLLLEDSLRSE